MRSALQESVKLSIVIPAYNEEDRLPLMLGSYGDYFSAHYGSDFELIVVVNGSRDRTADVARSFAERCPQIRVIEEPRPVGKGGAIMIGFEAARGERIGFVDADGATPPESFDDLARNIGSAGAVIANRYRPDSVVSPPQPLKRRIASRCFNLLVRILFRVRTSDTQCGAKVLSREAVRCVLPVIGVTRWAFDVDLLFQLRRAGFEIAERPTVWHDIGGSQLRIGRASLEMFIAMIRLRILYSPLRWVVALYDRTLGRFTHRNR